MASNRSPVVSRGIIIGAAVFAAIAYAGLARTASASIVEPVAM